MGGGEEGREITHDQLGGGTGMGVGDTLGGRGRSKGRGLDEDSRWEKEREDGVGLRQSRVRDGRCRIVRGAGWVEGNWMSVGGVCGVHERHW